MLVCLRKPPLNADTGKALSLPLINPIDRHGRVFFFAWLSFFLSFLAWYGLPPLLHATISEDLRLTPAQVSTSNIIALVAGLLCRLVAGTLCDKVGPRYVLVGILWAAAIPCGLTGLAVGPKSLYAIRFFIGISGGAFVPTTAWVTAWFDKRVIGTATAFAGGWGDAGVGVTFFVMPAVFESLVVQQGLAERVAWRVSFIVPSILLLSMGALLLLLCDDTPDGPWKQRRLPSFSSSSSTATIVAIADTEGKSTANKLEIASRRPSEVETARSVSTRVDSSPPSSFRANLPDLFCRQTLLLMAFYFVTFGGTLVMNSTLVSFYLEKYPTWNEKRAGDWAATFGLYNFVSRPAGGLMADVLYRRAGDARGPQVKKYWVSLLCVFQGAFALWIGLANPAHTATFIGGVSALAIVMEMGNGATYALLPHVNPHIAGLMGGSVGSAGNLGGIIFSIVYRYTSHTTTVAVVGAVSLSVGVLTTIVHPIPKAQRLPYGP